MDHNAAYLLKHLRTERETVAECWRRMNVQRSVLQRIIELDYDELVNGGLRLHGATTSQAAKLSLHIEIDGIRYSHISRYQPIAYQDTEEYLASHYDAVRRGERSWEPGDKPWERPE
jgi:hypothetical protein